MTDFAPRSVTRPIQPRRKIIDRRRRIIIRTGTYGNLPRPQGVTGGLGTATGTLVVSIQLTGTAAGTGTSTGTPNVPGNASLVGNAPGFGIANGALAAVHAVQLVSPPVLGTGNATGKLSGPPPGVTYTLRPDYLGNYGGGVITYGPYGTAFDIGAALADGNGYIFTNDGALIHELDRYPPLYRVSAIGTPVPQVSNRFESVSAGNGLYLSENAFEVRQNNESYPRFQILADGTVYQGLGLDPPTLFQPAANSLVVSAPAYVSSVTSPSGHYWLLSSDDSGRLVTTDAGTDPPASPPYATTYRTRTGTTVTGTLVATPMMSAILADILNDAGKFTYVIGKLVKITAWGTFTGTAGTKAVGVRFLSTDMGTVTFPAGANGGWRVQGEILMNALAVQVAHVQGLEYALSTPRGARQSSTITLNGAQSFQIYGTLGNIADSIVPDGVEASIT